MASACADGPPGGTAARSARPGGECARAFPRAPHYRKAVVAREAIEAKLQHDLSATRGP